MLHNKKKLIISIVLITITLLIIWFFIFEPTKTEEQLLSNEEKVDSNFTKPNVNSTEIAKDQSLRNGMPDLAPSLQGTEVNCPLQVDSKQQLILSRSIRDCFDYFLSSVGEKTENQLITDIQQYLTVVLPQTAQPYAYELLHKYINYRNQLKNLNGVSSMNADAFRQASANLSNLRKQIFTPAEAEVFFGQEEIYDRYAISQYEINNNKNLTASEKAIQSANLIQQQPSSLTDSMKDIILFNQLETLTKEIKARQGSDAEVYEMQKKLVGQEAADRLKQLNIDENKWVNRVNDYLAQRKNILENTKNPNQQQSLALLKENAFPQPEERLRVKAFEEMHDSNIPITAY